MTLFTSATGLQLRSEPFRRIIAWSTTTPRGRTIHDLRHYAASAWLRAGIPVNQVSKWLGHANASTTLNVYAHVLGEEQEVAAIARLDAQAADGGPFSKRSGVGPGKGPEGSELARIR